MSTLDEFEAELALNQQGAPPTYANPQPAEHSGIDSNMVYRVLREAEWPPDGPSDADLAGAAQAVYEEMRPILENGLRLAEEDRVERDRLKAIIHEVEGIASLATMAACTGTNAVHLVQLLADRLKETEAARDTCSARASELSERLTTCKERSQDLEGALHRADRTIAYMSTAYHGPSCTPAEALRWANEALGRHQNRIAR